MSLYRPVPCSIKMDGAHFLAPKKSYSWLILHAWMVSEAGYSSSLIPQNKSQYTGNTRRRHIRRRRLCQRARSSINRPSLCAAGWAWRRVLYAGLWVMAESVNCLSSSQRSSRRSHVGLRCCESIVMFFIRVDIGDRRSDVDEIASVVIHYECWRHLSNTTERVRRQWVGPPPTVATQPVTILLWAVLFGNMPVTSLRYN